MVSLCIKTNNSSCLNYLLNELKHVELDKVYYVQKKFKHYNNIIIHYLGNNISKFYSKISSIISFMIIDELEESILLQILSYNYFYFNTYERGKILTICYEIMGENFHANFNQKYNSLYNELYSIISNNKNIFLPGIINFRLTKYNKILSSTINDAVNNFIIEKEYLEFISLLKLYINSNSCKSGIIHLIYSENDTLLLDENKNIINPNNEIFKAKILSDISFSANDYILNTLLDLLPNKIFIHLINKPIDEFINTLLQVFQNRISLCTNCNICKIYKNSDKLIKNKSRH
jgi:putative sporulation protein YtxC